MSVEAPAAAAAIDGVTGETAGPDNPIETPTMTAAPTIKTVTVEVTLFHTGELMTDRESTFRPARRVRPEPSVRARGDLREDFITPQDHHRILRGFLAARLPALC
ncbi:hypothetical protein B7R25_15715 [Subtercola boreus]|uniref:Uncharacterized protein n=1 Tax=Subtercola boreus TaxID=120213 RepID=A0A3E0W8D5_9MICO|nr:hypothetical protein [Subtercola boreus]RFA18089.1 hypothetical protein B7R24_15685 [Subtercola boreus]RFA18471.1 hypothetical protein B7R23_15720 [Subtercola boreus]RFA24999.1 hypothetical protein B7R25_15715 [Subtercola boreus]